MHEIHPINDHKNPVNPGEAISLLNCNLGIWFIIIGLLIRLGSGLYFVQQSQYNTAATTPKVGTVFHLGSNMSYKLLIIACLRSMA